MTLKYFENEEMHYSNLLCDGGVVLFAELNE